jgi:hypothetical protein
MEMRKTILATGLAGILLLSMQAAAETPERAPGIEALLTRLEALTPREPTTPAPDTVGLIREVGATKRLDAALLLVRALAFGFSPIGWSESTSPFGSIPAAQALKDNFGPQVLPILMLAGVTAPEGWMQTRLALTIREIGTAEEIRRLRRAFSTDEAKNLIAKRFSARLTEPDISLADDPVLSQYELLYKMIEELRKTQREPSGAAPP